MNYRPFTFHFDTKADADSALALAMKDRDKLGRVIIGFRGKRGAGKDTAASFCDQLVKVAFADKLRSAVHSVFGLSYDQMLDRNLKDAVVDSWGLTPRFILQRFGTEVARSIHSETWIRALKREIDADSDQGLWPPVEVSENGQPGGRRVWQVEIPAFAITDVRFINEANAIKEWGGYVVEITRPGCDGDNHASETELDGYPFDYTLANDSTLEEFKKRVEDLLAGIRLRHEKIWLW